MSFANFGIETDADGIALVTWDMPGRSMNVFTEEVMRELDAIVDRVAGDAVDPDGAAFLDPVLLATGTHYRKHGNPPDTGTPAALAGRFLILSALI